VRITGGKMGKGNKGSRKSYTFSLNLDDKEHLALAEKIDNLKADRQFSPTVRDALRLILDLRDGNIDVLEEMFPQLNTGAPDDLLIELEEIKKLLVSSSNNGTYPEEKFDLPITDDLLNELDEIKKLLVSSPNNTVLPEERFELSITGDLLNELEEIKKLLLSPPNNAMLAEEKTEVRIGAADELLNELQEIKDLLTSIVNLTLLPEGNNDLTNGATYDLLNELKQIKDLLTSPRIQPVAMVQPSQWKKKKPVITEITEKNAGSGDGSAANNLLSSLNDF
jgi:hypothetical protein